MFRQDFSCPALLVLDLSHYPYRTITFLGHSFQSVRVLLSIKIGLVRVRSPLLAESRLISFPPGT